MPNGNKLLELYEKSTGSQLEQQAEDVILSKGAPDDLEQLVLRAHPDIKEEPVTALGVKDRIPTLGQPEPSITSNVSSALALGKDQIDKSFWIKMQADAEQGVGLGSMMASTFGEDFLPGRIEENEEQIRINERKLLAEFERRPLQFSDAWNDPEYFFTFAIPEIVGQVAGLMGIPIATTLTGAVIGAAATIPEGGVGAIPGAILGMAAGTGISSYQESASEAGGAIEQAIAEAVEKNPNMTPEELEQVRNDAFVVSEKIFDRNMAWLTATNSAELALSFLPPVKMATMATRTATTSARRVARTAARFKQFRPRVGGSLRLGAIIAM